MVDAHSGDDDIAFYAATLGATRRIEVTVAPAQLADVDGPLVPGRHLLHLRDFKVGDVVWVAMGSFVKGETLVVVGDIPHLPMAPDGIAAIEVNVREDVNDQVAALVVGGGNPTGNLYITLVSRAL